MLALIRLFTDLRIKILESIKHFFSNFLYILIYFINFVSFGMKRAYAAILRCDYKKKLREVQLKRTMTEKSRTLQRSVANSVVNNIVNPEEITLI